MGHSATGRWRTALARGRSTLRTARLVVRAQGKRDAHSEAQAVFVSTLLRDGDLDAATIAVFRNLLDTSRMDPARTLAQVLDLHSGMAGPARVARALLALQHRDPGTAWPLLSADRDCSLRLAPAEYFRAGFQVDPETARATLSAIRGADQWITAGPRIWTDIARTSFVAGAEDLSQWALEQVDLTGCDDGLRDRLSADAAWLRSRYGRASSGEGLAAPGELPVAVFDNDHPQKDAPPGNRAGLRSAERDGADQLEVRAALAELARRCGRVFLDDAQDAKDVTHSAAPPPARSAATVVSTSVPQARRLRPAIRLHGVTRDATRFSAVPKDTWLFVTGTLMRPLFGTGFDFPFHPNLLPIFVSVRIDRPRMLTPEALRYLRTHGPVGCRDWPTVYLLHAAGVPAFHSGEPGARALATMLEPVFGAIAASSAGVHDSGEVYARWRAACQQRVDAAERRCRLPLAAPPSRFDVVQACRKVRTRSVVVERSAPAPAGEEIHVEFSLDGNLKRQLDVVLHGVLSRASRPVRAHILCRDHDEDDFARVAARFPELSVEWLPADDLDYGRIRGMIDHITVATMDRLLLPDLLPDVARIVHHDLDALCLADLAELFDVELDDRPLAARTSPDPIHLSGWVEFLRAANRMPPELAEDFLRRMQSRHEFDFEIFNAGVMVLNLERMRADDFGRQYLPYATHFGLNDQGVLNAYAGSQRVVLDPAWNWHPRLEVIPEPKLAHWAGPTKPWGRRWVYGKELWATAEAELESRVRARASSPALTRTDG